VLVFYTLNIFFLGSKWFQLFIPLLLLSSLAQPLYFDHVIRTIEEKNKVSFGFSIKALNIEINTYLVLVVPVGRLVASLVKLFIILN
jgi:hypothetical protein